MNTPATPYDYSTLRAAAEFLAALFALWAAGILLAVAAFHWRDVAAQCKRALVRWDDTEDW